MTHVRSWRVFKRMQGTACAFAGLVYAAAAVHGWRVLPGTDALKTLLLLAFPSVYFLACLVLPLQIGPVRRLLKRYVWLSFASGFGQSVRSMVVSLGLLSLAAAFIYAQIGAATHGGRYPSGAFSAFAAGAGILVAQALLVFALEREPKVRAIIEA